MRATSDYDQRTREYYAEREAVRDTRAEIARGMDGDLEHVPYIELNTPRTAEETARAAAYAAEHLQPAMKTTRAPRARQAKRQAKEATATRKATVTEIKATTQASQAKPEGPQLSGLDQAVEQLVREYGNAAVIDAAWSAAHRIFGAHS